MTIYVSIVDRYQKMACASPIFSQTPEPNPKIALFNISEERRRVGKNRLKMNNIITLYEASF